MRPDQRKRLEELTEKLADVVLLEADPDEWPGATKGPADLSQQERGDRYWAKKNAAATLALLERTQRTLSDAAAGGAHRGDAPGEDLDRDIKDAERRAQSLLDKVKAKAGSVGRGA
jgi:hypothetical protein